MEKIDRRSKQRATLHAPHDWQRRTPGRNVHRPGEVLVGCPCGWSGWVAEAVAPAMAVPLPEPEQ